MLMQILDKTHPDKVNFIDHNDLFVGYDLALSCCEKAGWYIADSKRIDTDDEDTIITGLEDYVFEPVMETVEDSCLDAGTLVRFRLTATGKPDLFLHIFNAHNGYYGHELIVKKDNKQISTML
jgi:hypothetical protein